MNVYGRLSAIQTIHIVFVSTAGDPKHTSNALRAPTLLPTAILMPHAAGALHPVMLPYRQCPVFPTGNGSSEIQGQILARMWRHFRVPRTK